MQAENATSVSAEQGRVAQNKTELNKSVLNKMNRAKVNEAKTKGSLLICLNLSSTLDNGIMGADFVWRDLTVLKLQFRIEGSSVNRFVRGRRYARPSGDGSFHPLAGFQTGPF